MFSAVSARVLQGAFDVALHELRITGVIGRGASGVVHSVVHAPSGTLFALKVLPLDVREAVRKRIIAELRCLHAALQCPAIVPLHAAFLSEGSVAIVLEHMDRGSLADLLVVRGALGEAHLRAIAARVLLGLAFLHGTLNVIHRDLKPSNLLLNSRGEVKISDFGVSGQLAHGRAESSSWLGTARYMAPERIGGGTYGAARMRDQGRGVQQDEARVALTRRPRNRLHVRLLGAGHHAAGVRHRCVAQAVRCSRHSAADRLLDVALVGCFPYEASTPSAAHMDFWELLECITERAPPSLPCGVSPADGTPFSAAFHDIVNSCLRKDPAARPSAAALAAHEWVAAAAADPEGGEALLAELVRDAPNEARRGGHCSGAALPALAEEAPP